VERWKEREGVNERGKCGRGGGSKELREGRKKRRRVRRER
jgi:hypothetical protein